MAYVYGFFLILAGEMDPGFQALCNEATMFKRNAFASTTKVTYKCQLNAYMRFCIYFGRVHLPADQTTLCAYIAFLARSLNPSSLPGYINIVRIIHVQAGFVNPFKDNWELSMIRRGILRKLGRPPVQKLPITQEILCSIFECLDFSRLGELSFWCACLICFFGLLRKNTLLPYSVKDLSSSFLVRGDVVSLNETSFLLKIRKTKTIQFGQRILSIPFVMCEDKRLCPVRFLLRHLVHSPLPKEMPLFSYIVKGCPKCWTHKTFVLYLKKLLENVGYPSKDYSGHSFRRGGCSLCFEAGLSITDIELRGDWRSNSFERYIYVPASSVFKSAAALALFVSK